MISGSGRCNLPGARTDSLGLVLPAQTVITPTGATSFGGADDAALISIAR